MTAPTQDLTLFAPLSGVLVPIETLPDPVFAGKLVGDGISVDPTSDCVLAPCDGEVIQLHPAHHALSLRGPGGVEIMIHVGLDTVKLRGEGFQPQVALGDRVNRGDPLLSFDLDAVACQARSLLTQMVVTNGEIVLSSKKETGGTVTAGSDAVLRLELKEGAERAEVMPLDFLVSDTFLCPNPQGLHARPSAVLAAAAKKFAGQIRLRAALSEANAKSVVSVMALNVQRGDKLSLAAQGEGAREMLDHLLELIRSGLGETVDPMTTEGEGDRSGSVDGTPPAEEAAPRSGDPKLLLAVSASPGLAVGRIFQLRREEIPIDERPSSPAEERRRLQEALDRAEASLDALEDELRDGGETQKAEIFAAHRELLQDPDLLDAAESGIAKGASAPAAWRQAFQSQAQRLEGLDNPLLQERAADCRDAGFRVLRILAGVPEHGPEVPPDSILVAEELTPSDTAAIDRARVKAFCTVGGGATSHVAIIARSMDLPALVGAEARVLSVKDGTMAILDGGSGRLRLDPPNEELEATERRMEAEAVGREAAMQACMDDAVTTDGHRILVCANAAKPADGERAVALGAEGIGLLRSEFLFMDRRTPPTEEEQQLAYEGMLDALGPDRTLTLRTLDVGGDKPLSYLPIPKEENPFLGERGIRICLDRPRLLRSQIRAALRAAPRGKLQIMFPMVAFLDEFRRARAIVQEEAKDLGLPPVATGIMIEVPCAAAKAEAFAREVDFFSIGTNDLTQYALAMDRGHPRLASRIDALDPGVLRLIHMTCEGAHGADVPVSVCGGAASDPAAVPFLIGLGVNKLSVSLPAIPLIKARIRELKLSDCKALAVKALAAESADAVRALRPSADERSES